MSDGLSTYAATYTILRISGGKENQRAGLSFVAPTFCAERAILFIVRVCAGLASDPTTKMMEIPVR